MSSLAVQLHNFISIINYTRRTKSCWHPRKSNALWLAINIISYTEKFPAPKEFFSVFLSLLHMHMPRMCSIVDGSSAIFEPSSVHHKEAGLPNLSNWLHHHKCQNLQRDALVSQHSGFLWSVPFRHITLTKINQSTPATNMLHIYCNHQSITNRLIFLILAIRFAFTHFGIYRQICWWVNTQVFSSQSHLDRWH